MFNIPDQNECQKNTSNNCSTNAVCKNVTGSYKCVCNTGYEGNGTICNGKFSYINLISK